MRPSEKRLLIHYYGRNSNDEEKLRLKLFKLVNSGVTTDEEAKLKLASKGGASSYSHLKSRLKDDILNILLMQDSSKRFAQSNRAAELDCRKKVAQSHILWLRGAEIEGMKTLDAALKVADKYELLAERLQINHLIRERLLGAGLSDQLVKLNKEIGVDIVKYEALLKVQEKSFTLASPEFAKKLKSKANEKQNLELIEELKTLYRKHKLARIGFWYYMAATEFHNAHKSFDLVAKLGLEFLKLVEKSPAVKSKNNIAGVNQTVGIAYMELRQFNEAQRHLVKSEEFFPSAGFNRLQCLQFLVQSESALGLYDNALVHVQTALDHPRIGTREILVARWWFFKACVEFGKGNFEAALKSLNKDGNLLKQVDEWNIQLRVLEMMLLVEQRDEEWLEFKLDATRKFLNRHKELYTERIRFAVDATTFLLRRELEMVPLSDALSVRLKDNLEEKPGFEWNPTGPELVRFDKWLAKRQSLVQAENELSAEDSTE
ncbi:MAG: hypothetical protein H6603_07175 [Flavobacteriales bacterium]|nr:hypothetical protein [Flavobacteriales bacterium]MCB9204745.1 hypothetical protein [Flavobacteriales bacterium]